MQGNEILQPLLWAVTDTSYRAVLSEVDLLPGETLIEGERPVQQDQLAAAIQKKTQSMSIASERIAPLQDAVDLEIATTEDAAQLCSWKEYRVLLNRVDPLITTEVAWPIQPQRLLPNIDTGLNRRSGPFANSSGVWLVNDEWGRC
ncbi:hypothetical protein DXF93_06775 [Escherichia coli]|nr:hypothetical protein DXF93_06775 [Escherichia coli]